MEKELEGGMGKRRIGMDAEKEERRGVGVAGMRHKNSCSTNKVGK